VQRAKLYNSVARGRRIETGRIDEGEIEGRSERHFS